MILKFYGRGTDNECRYRFKMKIKVLKVLRGATLGMCMDITVMVPIDTNLRKQNQNHYKSL